MGEFARKRREPVLPRAVQQLEEHGLTPLAVAQDVGLCESNATAELVEADTGHGGLREHRSSGVEDRLSPNFALLRGEHGPCSEQCGQTIWAVASKVGADQPPMIR